MFGDGPQLGNEWEYSRVLAFVLRPNAFARYRLRRTLKLSLYNLRKSLSSLHSTGHNNSSTDTQRSSLHIHGAHNLLSGFVREPILGIHIRHGDSHNDGRFNSGPDRSFESHMTCARQLISELGLPNTVFLSTDNATLFALAPTQFPDFTWFAQRRELGLHVGRSFDYHHEKSKQQEIVNILVSSFLMRKGVYILGTISAMRAYLLLIICLFLGF